MKKLLLSIVPLIAALPLMAAEAKTEVSTAVKGLADKDYSWKSTVTMPESTRFRMGPTEGKTQKGTSHFIMSMGDNKIEAVVQGEKRLLKNQQGEWVLPSEVSQDGPGRGMGMMTRNLRTPAVEAAELLQAAKDFKKDGDAFSAELSEDGVKKMLTFRRGGQGQGGEAPAVANPKGSVKFWVKDGILSKYEYRVQGSVTFNNNERQVDRTTTVEIKDIGSTKLDIPEAARKKLS